MLLVKYETNPTHLDKKKEKKNLVKLKQPKFFFFGNYITSEFLKIKIAFLLMSIHLTLRCIWSSKFSSPLKLYLCACFVVLHSRMACFISPLTLKTQQRALACFCQFLFTFSFLASQLPCPWPPSFALAYNIIIKIFKISIHPR